MCCIDRLKPQSEADGHLLKKAKEIAFNERKKSGQFVMGNQWHQVSRVIASSSKSRKSSSFFTLAASFDVMV